MKKLFRVAVFCLILFVGIFLARNVVLKVSIEKGVQFFTGLEMKMDKLRLGIFETDFKIQGLKIYNPSGFAERIMLDMPEVYIDYDLGDILGKFIHLESLVIDLKKFNVVKDENDNLNLNSLLMQKDTKEKQKEDKKVKPGEIKTQKEAIDFKIDKLVIRLGEISFIKYVKGENKPKLNNFPINIDEEFKDVETPHFLVAYLIQKVILKASYAKLTSFNLGGLQDTLTNTFGDVQKFTGEAFLSAKNITENLVTKLPTESLEKVQAVGEKTIAKTSDSLKNLTKTTASTAGKTAKEAKEVITNLFSKISE